MSDQRKASRDEVLAACVTAAENDSFEIVERACAEHPALAADIRRAVAAVEALRSLVPHDATRRSGAQVGITGKYDVIREIGRGGSGIVYEVRDKSLGRRVALKTPTPEVALSPESLERFRREARALALVQHENIPAILEIGESPGGMPYLTMELIEGASLEMLLARLAPGSPARLETRDLASIPSTLGADGLDRARSYASMIVRLAATVADALAAAHRAGIVHRDVKPANILVDASGKPYLVDFGIARLSDAATVTRPDNAPGTPAYMSPEQVTGRRVDVGPKIDIYGLGATLYHCLALRPPFDGESTAQVFDQIRRVDPTPLRRLNPSVPRDLEAVVAKAMEKDIARRYGSARDLKEDLDALLALRPVKARVPGVFTRSVKWVKRNQMGAAAVAVLALAATVLASRAFSAVTWLREGDRAISRYLDKESTYLTLDEGYAAASAKLGAYLDETERGRIAKLERERDDARSQANEALVRAQEAYREAARLAAWMGPIGAQAEAGLERTSVYRRGVGPGRGEVTIVSDPEGATAHLFRYENYERFRDEAIPRLVPVPVSPSGTTVDVKVAGVLPGDPCVVITAVEPGSPADRMGIRVTDLVHRIQGAEAARSLFVAEIIPGSSADEQRIPPYSVIRSVDDLPMRSIMAWESVPARGPSGSWNPLHRCRIVAPDGTEFSIDADVPKPAEFSGLPGSITPTRAFVRAFGNDSFRSAWTTLEAAIGVEVADGPGLLARCLAAPLGVVASRAGNPVELTFDAGEELGITAEVTAYPLYLTALNELNREHRRGLALPAGSYLLFLTAPGRESLRLPFKLGDKDTLVLQPTLIAAGSTPPGFVYVHGGSFIYQGDPDVAYPEARQVVAEEEFFVGRNELTMDEWLDYLNQPETLEWLRDRGGVDLVRWLSNLWSPTALRSMLRPHHRLVPRRISGAWARLDERTLKWCLPGDAVSGDSPVAGITRDDAEMYVAWRNERARRRREPWVFSLPTLTQWEKAARGVDGRIYVWGDRFDFALTHSLVALWRGSGEALILEPGGRLPTDESPFGVRDLAGGVAEWNLGQVWEYPSWHPLRGGSWMCSTAVYFRAASKSLGSSDLPDRGLRLVARRRNN